MNGLHTLSIHNYPAEPNAATSERRAVWLGRLASASLLVLLGATWPLWTPEHAFPQIPAFAWLGRLPDAAQWMLLAPLVALPLGSMLAPARGEHARWRSGCCGVTAVVLALVMAFDQHRWQPWAYHLGLTFWALALLPAAVSRRWLAWLTISVYAYSACSKLDATFLDTLGQQFAGMFLKPIWPSWIDLSSAQRRLIAALFPAGELGIALLLAWPRTRRFGLIGAVISHVGLIAILGPWGLGHQPGVLIWNAYFLAQDVLLFAGPGRAAGAGQASGSLELSPRLLTPSRAPLAMPGPDAKNDAVRAHRTEDRAIAIKNHAGRALLGLALAAPLVEPWGYWDHWFAWGLYSPRVERLRLVVPRAQAGRLPPALAPFFARIDGEPDWLELRLDRWSLAASRAPLVPQVRFQLGIAAWVAEQRPWGDSARVVLYGAADRRAGRRERETLAGVRAIETACDRYWLNARPRAFEFLSLNFSKRRGEVQK